MRPRTAYVLAGLTVLAGAAALSGWRPLMIAGGLPLGLILPGVALTALLFRPGGRDLTLVERLMLAPALSLGSLVLGGLLLWAARAPLHRTAWLTLSVVVTLGALAGVVARQAPATTSFPVRLSPALIAPAAVAVLLLAGAITLSLISSIRSHDVRVTTLSVVPPPAADASGTRNVQVNASGLTYGTDHYTLVVTSPSGAAASSMPVVADAHGSWTSMVRLPSNERLTLGLYEGTSATALRTVILAATAG